jgi:Yip1 domain
MIKALLLLIEPIATWEGIARARRGILFILGTFLLPLLVLTSAAEGYGLVKWGKWQDIVGLRKFPVRETVVLEIAQLLLSLLIVFAGANMIKAVGETFRGRHTYGQAFTTVAYSLSPLFILRLLDAFCGISPWVAWAIGIVLSVVVLYQGVPRMMEPDPSHAFGLYVMSALLLVLFTGLMQYLFAAYLQAKLPKLQEIVSDLAARLPF